MARHVGMGSPQTPTHPHTHNRTYKSNCKGECQWIGFHSNSNLKTQLWPLNSLPVVRTSTTLQNINQFCRAAIDSGASVRVLTISEDVHSLCNMQICPAMKSSFSDTFQTRNAAVISDLFACHDTAAHQGAATLRAHMSGAHVER